MFEQKYFLSVDWGTSNLRVRLVEIASRKILQTIQAGQGVQQVWRAYQEQSTCVREAFFANVLKSYLPQVTLPSNVFLNELPIIISGMASASIGWRELPYAPIPFRLDGTGLVGEQVGENELINNAVWLLSGLQKSGDVMRGEEVQAMGLNQAGLHLPDDFLLILPGTHSKHIFVSKGMIRDFHTFLTGELFHLLSAQSVLQHALPKPLDTAEWNRAAFAKGVQVAENKQLTQNLFPVRALSLQGDLPPNQAFSYLSGLLIGAEIQTIERNQSVILAAPKKLLTAYETALKICKLEQFTILTLEQMDQLVVGGQLTFLQKIT